MAANNILAIHARYPFIVFSQNPLVKKISVYNGNVRDMKNLREMFPSSIVGGMFGFDPGTFFELENEAERVIPKVEV